jgi:hypothetical protein
MTLGRRREKKTEARKNQKRVRMFQIDEKTGLEGWGILKYAAPRGSEESGKADCQASEEGDEKVEKEGSKEKGSEVGGGG